MSRFYELSKELRDVKCVCKPSKFIHFLPRVTKDVVKDHVFSFGFLNFYVSHELRIWVRMTTKSWNSFWVTLSDKINLFSWVQNQLTIHLRVRATQRTSLNWKDVVFNGHVFDWPLTTKLAKKYVYVPAYQIARHKVSTKDFYWKDHRVFECHRKSLIQQCERSEQRLHFEWTKVN